MTNTNTRLLADIRQLAPQFAARAAEFEAQRRIPPDVVEIFRSIGIFRMFVPHSHDGMELDLLSGLEVISTLARIDGSLGWAAMVGGTATLATPLLPRETYDLIYRNGPDVTFAGTAQPSGTAERAPGGWRVTGRWSFASSCENADWMFAACIMTEDGKPLPGPAGAEGPPLMRGLVLPSRDWQIEDTWYVAGLKATGSHHIALKDAFVPDANLLDIFAGVPCQPGPLYQALLPVIPLMHDAVHVGIAEGSLDDLVAMARTGRQQLRAAVSMQESEIFQYQLGRTAADVRAARTALQAQAASHWQHALAGTLKTPELTVEATQSGVWISATCCRAVDACFTLGGGSALYESSPLQRRLRDMHTAAQHASVQQRHYVDGGRLLLGKLPPTTE